MFADRKEAAQRLAEVLERAAPEDPVVLALPRGGVPVAAPIARRLSAPLDLLLVRKIGVPGQEEVAAGALVDGEPPQTIFNEDLLRRIGLTPADFARQIEEKTRQNAERRARYLRGRPPQELAGRTAIVVDDGIATGATVRAALRGLRSRNPAAVWLAVPVAPPDTVQALRGEVDRVFCLEMPEPFRAVGLHYREFPQVSDDEVIDALDAAWDAGSV